MLKLSHPITSINGFKIGDKVRLKDGDGSSHIIKSFSIDGMKEFFFEVQFEDGAETMLDNIAPLPSDLDEAANEEADELIAHMKIDGDMIYLPTAKALMIALARFGAEWMAGQGVKTTATVGYYNQTGLSVLTELSIKKLGFKEGDELEIILRKK